MKKKICSYLGDTSCFKAGESDVDESGKWKYEKYYNSCDVKLRVKM